MNNIRKWLTALLKRVPANEWRWFALSLIFATGLVINIEIDQPNGSFLLTFVVVSGFSLWFYGFIFVTVINWINSGSRTAMVAAVLGRNMARSRIEGDEISVGQPHSTTCDICNRWTDRCRYSPLGRIAATPWWLGH